VSSDVEALRAALAGGGLCALLCDHDAAEAARPVWGVRVGPDFVGRARTVAAWRGGLGAVRAAVEGLARDDVLVAAARGLEAALLGDTLAGEAAARGAAGAVVDGYVRDLAALAAGGLGVRARGGFPRRARGAGGGHADASVADAIDVAVDLAGVRVVPGDVIVADADGVVIVPASRLQRVAAELPGWLAAGDAPVPS